MTGAWKIKINGKEVENKECGGNLFEGIEVADATTPIFSKMRMGDILTIECILEE
jgi:hypothetical protein